MRCDRCGQPITGTVLRVPQFSASGARPDVTLHPGPALCGRPVDHAPTQGTQAPVRR